MCGLFGFSGKKGKAVNHLKLMLLGLYNESRGTDSCGYYYSGNIEKGTGMQSDWGDFIAKNKLTPGDLDVKVFMGHTRKATNGTWSYENAHPHVINDNYVQTHNGIIKEIWPLCNKYDVPHIGINVDSIGLARLIEKMGPKVILDEYVGVAALAFTYKKMPESLFLYHGKSKEKKYGEPISERPMYYLKQPEGIYYSSLCSSLDAINVNPGKYIVHMLPHNKVYEVVNGEFTENTIEIDREENNIIFEKPVTTYNSAAPFVKPDSPYKMPPVQQTLLPAGNKVSNIKYEEPNDNDMIVNETFPEAWDLKVINSVYYHRGRYYNMYEFQVNPQEKPVIRCGQLDGEYVINRKGIILPNKTASSALNGDEGVFYFIGGIMIKSRQDFYTLRDKWCSGLTEDSFRVMSNYSKYPIIQIKSATGVGKTLWYWDGVKVNSETFSPKFSNKSYKIKKGKTVQIIVRDKTGKNHVQNASTI